MASESTSADIEGSVFQVLEGVVYYVDPTTSNAMNAFVGSKECVRIPLSGKHCSLQAFVKHAVEHAGLREEAPTNDKAFHNRSDQTRGSFAQLLERSK